MARALRIERPGGRYHVTARGNERKAIYRDDRYRAHFLQLLGEAGGRFGLRIHAYVLMENHFHLLVETPEANLSRAMQWMHSNVREQTSVRKMTPRRCWPDILTALEEVRGERWSEFSPRHGDWGRDAALWLGRRHGRYKLAELGQLAGDMDYAAVSQVVTRFGQRLERQTSLKKMLTEIENQFLNV
jgi:REP element-mobilizing transposase RayT